MSGQRAEFERAIDGQVMKEALHCYIVGNCTAGRVGAKY